MDPPERSAKLQKPWRPLCSATMLALAWPLAAFSSGALVGWLGRKSRSADTEIWAEPRFHVSCWFGCGVLSPIAGYFLLYAPDWAFAYLVAPSALPRATVTLLIVLSGLSFPAGFAVSAANAERTPQAKSPVAAIASGLAALGVLLATVSRLVVDTTYAGYHGDLGTGSIASGRLGYALFFAFSVVGLASLGLARLFADANRH